MNRRNMMAGGLSLLGGSLLGVPVWAQEEIRNRHMVKPIGPETGYTRVRGNPRHPATISSWAEAKAYMLGEGFHNDVSVRLARAIPSGFAGTYKSVVLPALYGVIHEAEAHNYMTGNCSKCSGTCEAEGYLRKEFRRVQIEPGTLYLGVTEGLAGKVRFNRRFRAPGKYYAYRVELSKLKLKEFYNSESGKRWALYGRTYFDLIALCRNVALGEVELWELVSTEFKPPVETEIKEVPMTPPEAKAYAEAEAKAKAEANATGGNVTINNFPAPTVFGYNRPESPNFHDFNYVAGGITVQAVPRFNIHNVNKQWQSQQQQQQQQQWQQLWNEITNINQNLNNISIAVANG
jgi:hypothetical protein